jgi:hypothetical protein
MTSEGQRPERFKLKKICTKVALKNPVSKHNWRKHWRGKQASGYGEQITNCRSHILRGISHLILKITTEELTADETALASMELQL